ncbi:MAG: M20 family metallopeptidase [Endomicrobia bacterium]|nr:M20 family metallopeptidase [Endomicrobiia bacterium]
MTIENEIIRIRRHIHKYPETGGNEYNTAKFIESKLKELKIPYKRIAKTGIVGLLKGAKSGVKTAALRADIDALTVQEDNNIEYKSRNNGVMHACGHDAHTAIMLGAAKILSKKKDSLNGNVKFIFQPSEETAAGAEDIIKGGALVNPKVDVILGVHVCPWIESGKIGIKYGEMMAAVDKINVEIEGEIAHGAYPHLGKDALTAAAAFISMIQTIVSREINPVDPSVITLGKIKGGDAYNIICEKIEIEGTVRCLDNKIRKYIKESILRKLKAVEIAYGVKCKIEYQALNSPVINCKEIVKICHQSAKEFYGKQNVEILEKPSMGGEDFSEYLRKIPGNFMYIGTSKNKATSYPWHHSNFNIDENALPKAAKYVAYTVEELLK